MRAQGRGLVIAGLVGVCVFGLIFGVWFGKALWGRADIWWTPRSMALSLDESRHHFEVYVADALLQQRVSEGTLVLETDGRTRPATADDFAVRINNWESIRSWYFFIAVFAAFFLGLSAPMALFGWWMMRHDPDEAAGASR